MPSSQNQKLKTINYKLKTRNVIVGIDEVGRGPLAGPMVIAAVAVFGNPISKRKLDCLRGIRDSKKLSPRAREEWYGKLRNDAACAIAHSSVSASVIDRCGIVFAARLAVSRCLQKLTTNYKLQTINYRLLLDGSLFAPPEYKQKTIIKGDERIPIIAAASIIAKVTRDQRMRALHIKYPHYNFAQHKGYGTRAHMAAIRKHGLSEIHRKTFCTRII